ncbi:uncharacterized protein LOC131856864 [Cryptomeria japonica]|uniref:uncharacterized protein LOC131856864 n=1 Tax=Cryptomeria japonica TaxID=3369 RepID=UPI0027DA703E|nr:uncharacterized protein LOC131856864 [Cryptomeria japonica]
MTDLEKAIVAGDFNALLNNEEKLGGLRMNARVMEDFRDFVADNNLYDVVPKSGKFTWTNRRANFSRIFVGPFWIRAELLNSISKGERVEEELNRINNLVIEKGMTNEEFHVEKSLKAELAEILLREEMFWRDKSRELWIDAGDSNSKFFHASLKVKRNKNRINQLMEDSGKLVGKAEEIEI